MIRKLPKPTTGELAILRVLWQRGHATVREVVDELGRTGTVGYTTALKLMQIMTEKGLVERDERTRVHVYRAKLSEDSAQRRFVHDLLDTLFDGSAKKLVMQALSGRHTSPEELAEIRKLVNQLTGEKNEQ